MKQPARSFPLPQAVPQEGETVEETMVDPLNQPVIQEEASSVEAITDEIFLYVYKDGYDEIVDELKKKGDLPERVGNIVGNLVANEVMMLEEEGGEFPQDMFIEAATETVEQFTDIVENEKIKEFKNPQDSQAFMSEALTHAIGVGLDSDYESFNDDYMISTVESMLRGDMDMESTPVAGTRVIEEVV